jgi:hypothetical protein
MTRYAEGYAAFERSEWLSTNPTPCGPAYREWRNGWDAASYADPAKRARLLREQYGIAEPVEGETAAPAPTPIAQAGPFTIHRASPSVWAIYEGGEFLCNARRTDAARYGVPFTNKGAQAHCDALERVRAETAADDAQALERRRAKVAAYLQVRAERAAASPMFDFAAPHISDGVRTELQTLGFTLTGDTWSRLVEHVEEAGQLGDGARVVNLRLDDTGRWFESVDGWGVVLKDCDLRDYADDPRGAIRHLCPAIYPPQVDACRLIRISERNGRGGRNFRYLGQLQPCTLSHGRFGIELRCEGVGRDGMPVLQSFHLPRFKAQAKAAFAELERHHAEGTRTPAAAAWDAYQVTKDDRYNRPMAAAGLTSYRCKSAYSGFIMIGAKDDADALTQARRSRDSAQAAEIEIWDAAAGTYVPTLAR